MEILKVIAPPPTPYPTLHLFLLCPPCQVEVESGTSKLISDDSSSKINLGTIFGTLKKPIFSLFDVVSF